MSITLQHVSKSYGTEQVVRDVSLHVETGELFVLLGASGSGKSSLLRLIAGLLPVDSGRILLHDRDVTALSPQARGTGFVFQNYSLFRHMTVADNIAFGLSIRKVRRAEQRAKVEELLDLIDLHDCGDRLPTQLSGGQQQRVALARALAYQPNVLLLDEPFGALDVKIRAQLRTSLRAIQQRLGVTAILVTHDQEEAFDIADRIGVIDKGELLEVGAPTALYQRPQTSFTATFLGTANLLQARRNGTRVYIGDANLPAPPDTEHLSGQPVQVLCRPEEIAVSATRAEADAIGAVIGAGTVESISFAGHLQRVTVRLTDGSHAPLQIVLTPGDSRALALTIGQTVWLGVLAYHLLPLS
ncbi:MAG: ABC transporter ATP-binding protein [Chloroflexota bacterium]|nr:ABC transporter ATP-binding protein [Chloroflexota bacterium]